MLCQWECGAAGHIAAGHPESAGGIGVGRKVQDDADAQLTFSKNLVRGPHPR